MKPVPTEDERLHLLRLATQHTEILWFFERWLSEETFILLNKREDVSLQQGRCQILSEICNLFYEFKDAE